MASGTPTTHVVFDGAAWMAGLGSEKNGDPSQLNSGPFRVVVSVDAAGHVVSTPLACGFLMVSMSDPMYVASVAYALTPMRAKSAVTAIFG